MPRSPRPSLRVGHALVHCEVHEIGAVLSQLCQPPPVASCRSSPLRADADLLFNAVSAGAAAALDALVRRFPLVGRANTSLGTALRVKAVRSTLGKDEDCLRHMNYLAAAADAYRHLSPAVIEKTLNTFQQLLEGGAALALSASSSAAPSPGPVISATSSCPSSSAASSPRVSGAPSLAPAPTSSCSPSATPSLGTCAASAGRDLLRVVEVSLFDMFGDDDDCDELNEVRVLPPLVAFRESELRDAYAALLGCVESCRRELELTVVNCTSDDIDDTRERDVPDCDLGRPTCAAIFASDPVATASGASLDLLAVENTVGALYGLARAAAFIDDAFPCITSELALGVFRGFGIDEELMDEFDAPVCEHLDQMQCLRLLEHDV